MTRLLLMLSLDDPLLATPSPISQDPPTPAKDRYWASTLPRAREIDSWSAIFPPTLDKPRNDVRRGLGVYGQLTALGAADVRRIGESMRERYIHRLQFLPPTPCPNALHLRATNWNRTVSLRACVSTPPS